jgi:hypothetical protein
MKTIFPLVLMASVLLSCSKDDNMDVNGVVIKGDIPESNTRKSSQFAKVDGVSLADAKNVLVLFGDQSAISEIKEGRFSVSAPSGYAPALIFVDANNHYLGNLFTGGLNILPLVGLEDSSGMVIDLSSLSLEGTNVIPANDPIGSRIQLSQEEINMLRELGPYYESLADNIDTDKDGIPDNFSGEQIIVNTSFNIQSGTWGLDDTPASVADSDQLNVNYGVRIKGWKNLVPKNLNVSLTGPGEDPYNDIAKIGYNYDDHCECFDAFFSRQSQNQNGGNNQPPFKKGVYTFTMDGVNNHTINYSSIGAEHFLVLATPVLKTNADNRVNRIEINYTMPDKSEADYAKFITTLMVLVKDKNANELDTEGRIFDGMNILPDFENISLATPLNPDEIFFVNISYTDVVGNIYNLSWSRPSF